jgi:hypothetical protein
MKLKLADGCACSKVKVTPLNWHTKSAKTTINWYIAYRFYDPQFALPKQVKIRKMNYYKSSQERQAETTILLEQEIEKLKDGYNPLNDVKKEGEAVGRKSKEQVTKGMYLSRPSIFMIFQLNLNLEKSKYNIRWLFVGLKRNIELNAHLRSMR